MADSPQKLNDEALASAQAADALAAESTSVADEPGAPEAQDVALAPAALHGAKLIFLLGVVARATSFISQLVLGYLLSKEDFGLYATALGLSAMLSVFRDAGVGRLLIVRSAEYDRLARPVLEMATIFNALAAALLIGVGVLAAQLKDAPVLAWMMAVLAGSVILRSPTAVYRAKAMADLSFGLLWRIDVIGLLLQHSLLIILALAGLGPLSFVLPMLAVALYELIALGLRVGRAPGSRLTWPVFREIFHTTKWIMIGGAGIALVTQGDYLAVSLFESAAVLGLYFFGFRFASSVAQVFTGSLSNVLMPALTKARSDPQRLHRGFVRSLGLLALVMSFVGMFGAVTAPAFIHFVWQGRWDGAIPAAVAVFSTQMIRSVSTIGTIVAEATGRWRVRALMLAIDAAGTVMSAAIGAWLGGVVAIAVSVAVYRMLYGLAQSTVGAYLAHGGFTDVGARLLPTAFIGIVAAGAGWGLAHWLNLPIATLAGGTVAGAAYVILFVVMAVIVARPQIRELRQLRF